MTSTLDKAHVGLDLSYSSTGVVILEAGSQSYFAFKAGKPDLPFHERAIDLWKQLTHVLPPAEQCSVYIEGAAYAAEFGAFMAGELAGAIKVLLAMNGYRYTIVSPNQLKKFATGSGNAQKHYVAAHVMKKWEFTHKSNDVVDAYVLAKMSEDGWTELDTKRKG
jgi:crossover junction endodeoxyribonuclease RuvC